MAEHETAARPGKDGGGGNFDLRRSPENSPISARTQAFLCARELAEALGGRQAGSGWQACCPAHNDARPSLSISESTTGAPLVFCHAGCEQRAVIAALRQRGLWPDWTGHQPVRRCSSCVPTKPAPAPASTARRIEAAGQIWAAARPAEGTPVEIYLRSRSITVLPSAALRFHPGLRHPDGGLLPAMVGLVTNGKTGAPQGVHRTFLARDGRGKAPADPQRMSLGPCRGGAVCLGKPGEILLIGEGIETCLSAAQATGHAAWAALSTGGLRALHLPDAIRNVIVLADADDPGEAAARSCARRWASEGRHVRIARPPKGCDFNDLLQNRPLESAL